MAINSIDVSCDKTSLKPKLKDANIYKANSDEFKTSKNKKKVKKSVLTLPNYSTPSPERVSLMNDSEYLNRDDNRKNTKRTLAAIHTRKCRARAKDFEFYDRDAQYCSQTDINIDCSCTEMKRKYNGDGKGKSKAIVASNGTIEDSLNLHDVWAVLKNINRFQFTQSPPASEDSLITPKTTKCPRRRNNRKDIRVFETCCTEEFAYIISGYELDKSPYNTDKTTAINKQHDFDKPCTEYEERTTKKQEIGKMIGPNKALKHKPPKNKSPPAKVNNFKALTYINQKNKCDNFCEDSSFIICPNYGELKKLIADTSNASKNNQSQTIENYEGMSINIHDARQTSQCCEFISSENSGSSKAAPARHKRISNTKDRNKSVSHPKMQQLDENVSSDHQINGIKKVSLSNGQNVVQVSKAAKQTKRNLRQTSTISNNLVIIPKLTKNEIQRRLNLQKFPVVILGKDQVSSSVEVINEEHPQFNGLDKRMWPFMLNWYGIKQPDNAFKKENKTFDSNAQKKKGKCEEVEKKKMLKNINGLKQSKLKDKKSNTDHKQVPVPLSEILRQLEDKENNKPIKNLRDKMIKLLYKKSSVLSVIDTANNENNRTICTDTQNDRYAKDASTIDVDFRTPRTLALVKKHSWAKAKSASDFIENVIRKIKAGAYYTQDDKLNQNSDKVFKEVEIQTAIFTCDEPADESTLSIDIPGFNDTLNAVEIKTMNMNEISVKHCVTNIMFHFDVTIPTEAIVSGKNSSSLIPVDVTKSHARIYKYQNSILNAMLPAELCSILPKMLRNIVKSREKLEPVGVPIDKTSQLSIISEVSQSYNHIVDPLRPILRIKPLAPEIWQLLNGRYPNRDKELLKTHVLAKTSSLLGFEGKLEFTPLSETVHLFDYGVALMGPISVIVKEKLQSSTLSITSCKDSNTCTALQTYPVSDRKLVSSFKPFNLTSLFENMASFLNNIGSSCFKIINSIDNNSITINMNMRNSLKVLDIVALSVGNFKTDSTSNDCSNSLFSTNRINFFANITEETFKAPSRCIENVNCPSSNENTWHKSYVSVNNNKIRKKCYGKLYKKCKSTSNISRDKVTPLSKITNLDDFFHALGLGNFLSSVFDSQSEFKIMSSIQKMRNWTTEINSKQALLVLLLANKKETPNLLRFLPVLLQGIAVNRISKATELDMEIEVIEKENLNGLSQYDGITYLPASIENQDILFEELCWIAKTTASDHQMPFDKSSEKLLRSLLEKRKKLNPSYLRVLARYVGLGILNSPCKK